jgi:hypothetical protein
MQKRNHFSTNGLDFTQLQQLNSSKYEKPSSNRASRVYRNIGKPT